MQALRNDDLESIESTISPILQEVRQGEGSIFAAASPPLQREILRAIGRARIDHYSGDIKDGLYVRRGTPLNRSAEYERIFLHDEEKSGAEVQERLRDMFRAGEFDTAQSAGYELGYVHDTPFTDITYKYADASPEQKNVLLQYFRHWCAKWRNGVYDNTNVSGLDSVIRDFSIPEYPNADEELQAMIVEEMKASLCPVNVRTIEMIARTFIHPLSRDFFDIPDHYNNDKEVQASVMDWIQKPMSANERNVALSVKDVFKEFAYESLDPEDKKDILNTILTALQAGEDAHYIFSILSLPDYSEIDAFSRQIIREKLIDMLNGTNFVGIVAITKIFDVRLENIITEDDIPAINEYAAMPEGTRKKVDDVIFKKIQNDEYVDVFFECYRIPKYGDSGFEKLQERVQEEIAASMRPIHLEHLFDIKYNFAFPDDAWKSFLPEVDYAADTQSLQSLAEGVCQYLNNQKNFNRDHLKKYIQDFRFPKYATMSTDYQQVLVETCVDLLFRGVNTYDTKRQLRNLHVVEEIFSTSDTGFSTGVILNLIETGEGRVITEFLSNSKEVNDKIATKLIERGQKLTVWWYRDAFTGIDHLFNDMGEDEWKEMFTETEGVRNTEHTFVTDRFVQMAEMFGYQRMISFQEREGLSFHDAVHAGNKILTLYESSGLSENVFYNNILQQVQADNATYNEGTAHHLLNEIAQTMNHNVTEVMSKAKEYAEIGLLQDLAKTLSSPEAVFASWNNLKRYSALQQMIDKTKTLSKLKEIKEEGKDDLYNYAVPLLFHKDSKINVQWVEQFINNPEIFFAANASYTKQEDHNRKKSSNYMHILNLDLADEDLRDALVEGVLDEVSTFTPLEIRYSVPVAGEAPPASLRESLHTALGSRRNNIPGKAKNPGLLFSQINTLLKPYNGKQKQKRKKGDLDAKGFTVNDYLAGNDFPEEIAELEKKAEEFLYNEDFGIPRAPVKTQEYIAQIFRKDDPNGAITGNDTSNCMPFGDGKNTVYTFNPNTTQFAIRQVKEDGSARTIAQSVVTKNMDVHTSVPNIIDKLNSRSHLEDILPEDVLTTADTYLTCDNVEVAPNYKKDEETIEAIYRDFFTEYMKRYSEEQGLNTEKVPIGMGYADALTGLPKEQNTYIPQAPVSYTDNDRNGVYVLNLAEQEDIFAKKDITEHPAERQQPVSFAKGLSPLTYQDSIKVGYLEGKAYHDNESLVGSLFAMENSLIAKDINNAAKERPNLSVKYTAVNDSNIETMQGYLLAYEGKITDQYLDDDTYKNTPCIYIADFVANPSNRMAGGRLLKTFADLYKQHYLDTGNPIPIYAKARDTTSYPIIKKQLDNLGKQAGISFKLTELPTYTIGGDIMHPIVIEPVI